VHEEITGLSRFTDCKGICLKREGSDSDRLSCLAEKNKFLSGVHILIAVSGTYAVTIRNSAKME